MTRTPVPIPEPLQPDPNLVALPHATEFDPEADALPDVHYDERAWLDSLPIRPTSTPRGGRPRFLTRPVAERILVALRAGSHRTPAAHWAGISEKRFSDWMRWAGQHIEPFATFRHFVELAEAHAELRMVHALVKHATDSPRYALAYLERKFPDRWARLMAVNPQFTVNFDLAKMLEAVHAEIQRSKGGGERRALPSGPHDPRDPRLGPTNGHPALARHDSPGSDDDDEDDDRRDDEDNDDGEDAE